MNDDEFDQPRRAADSGDDSAGDSGQKKKGLWAVIIGILALLLIGGGAFWATTRGDEPAQEAGVPRQTEVPAPPPATSASPSAEETPDPNRCTTATEGFKPTTLTIDAMGVESHVVSVGYDQDGNPGAPDPNDAYGTAWFNGSASPGSPEGTTMLNIHTYRNGGALGNDLLDNLPDDALLKVTGEDGEVACFQVYEEVKIWVDSYSEDSPEAHRLHAETGEPNVAIVVCDDFDWGAEEWDSRVIWYAKRVE